jgi:hypothetical protein
LDLPIEIAIASCAVQGLRFLLGQRLEFDRKEFLEDEALHVTTASFAGYYYVIGWQFLLGYLEDHQVELLLELAFILLLPEGYLVLLENRPWEDIWESYDET